MKNVHAIQTEHQNSPQKEHPALQTLHFLKVPKREIFVTELFILSDPIWVGDLRNEPKKTFCVKC